ncbi:1995_t:CDS:1, partial [Diversispora eburnea]
MSLLLEYFNLDYEFFPATDVNSPEVEEEYQSVIAQSEDLKKTEVACTLSHLRIYQSIIDNNLKSALIFEDDIDIEMDIKHQISKILPYLPEDWEMFYIGHCCVENLREPFNYPTLYISTRPSCTHAYAVSNIGARKLLSILVKLKMPLDCVLVNLIEAGKIKSFSVEPPLVIQWRLGMGSDIHATDPSW